MCIGKYPWYILPDTRGWMPACVRGIYHGIHGVSRGNIISRSISRGIYTDTQCGVYPRYWHGLWIRYRSSEAKASLPSVTYGCAHQKAQILL